jgi:ABC-2 type transport system permease protein
MGTEVLRETLLDRRRSLIWWSVGIVALIAINLAFYPSIRDSAGLSNYAKDLPESMRAMFIGGELDLASPVGYLNSQVFALVVPGLFLIFSIGAGARAVAGEEERGTLDLILAQPISRGDYLIQRYLALLAQIAGLALVVLAAVIASDALVDLEMGVDKLVAATGGAALLGSLFAAVSMAMGAAVPGRGRAIAIGAGLATAAWLLDGLSQSVSSLEPFRPLSPFYQAVGHSPLREGVPWGAWALLAGASAVVVYLAARALNRRDIRQ